MIELKQDKKYFEVVEDLCMSSPFNIDSIDTGKAIWPIFFHVMASLADEEGYHRRAYARRSENARQLGRTGGRKRQIMDNKIKAAKKLLHSGAPPHDEAKTKAEYRYSLLRSE